jgi:two-component system sensor histidine kinase
MRTKVWFVLVCVCIVAVAAMVALLPPDRLWYVYPVCALAFVLLMMLLQSVIMPNSVVMRGMELIASQDFNNRLAMTGVHDADNIVTLFNTMIDRLRNERLHNREQENFLQLLIDASPMGVMMLDFDGKVTMANNAFLRLTGINDVKQLVGKFVEEAPEGLATEMQKVELGNNEVVRFGDIRMYRCYHLSFVQMGFQREFYLLESLTEEVMKAEREAYEKVIRTISHEVNNTMGGVRSVLDTLLDVTDDADIVKVIESCDVRCEQMCGFVSSYADVVRLPDPVKKPHDLNEEIGKLIPFLGLIVKPGVSVDFKPAAGVVNADIDSELMQQVFVNIVKNASESISHDNGNIWISTGIEGNSSVIEISNDGDPIDEAVSRQLFRPFFTTKRDGKGIGLTLTSEILNRHGATFRLATTPDGITRFRIHLPR